MCWAQHRSLIDHARSNTQRWKEQRQSHVGSQSQGSLCTRKDSFFGHVPWSEEGDPSRMWLGYALRACTTSLFFSVLLWLPEFTTGEIAPTPVGRGSTKEVIDESGVLSLSDSFGTRASLSTSWVKPHTACTRKPLCFCCRQLKTCLYCLGGMNHAERNSGKQHEEGAPQSSQYKQARFWQIRDDATLQAV